jgi:hypothetical protein
LNDPDIGADWIAVLVANIFYFIVYIPVVLTFPGIYHTCGSNQPRPSRVLFKSYKSPSRERQSSKEQASIENEIDIE